MSLPENTLRRYLTPNFIETGTCEGDSVNLALKCGFENIYSIEIDPNLYDFCKKRFDGKSNVHLYLGDSLIALPEILKDIKSPSTFWLDAHMNDVSTYVGKFRCPILSEIDMIFSHNINHTLLIDDRRLFVGNGIGHWGNVKESEIISSIQKHGSSISISYEDGVVPNDIIVAKL